MITETLVINHTRLLVTAPVRKCTGPVHDTDLSDGTRHGGDCDAGGIIAQSLTKNSNMTVKYCKTLQFSCMLIWQF